MIPDLRFLDLILILSLFQIVTLRQPFEGDESDISKRVCALDKVTEVEQKLAEMEQKWVELQRQLTQLNYKFERRLYTIT